MKPIDVRNMSWAEVMQNVSEARERVHNELHTFGPCTVRALADAIDEHVLAVAPRVTELCQLGLAELTGKEGRRGVYRAISVTDACHAFEAAKSAATAQTQLNLGDTACSH